MQIIESKITLEFLDNNFFRFENCQGYRNIQNHSWCSNFGAG